MKSSSDFPLHWLKASDMNGQKCTQLESTKSMNTYCSCEYWRFINAFQQCSEILNVMPDEERGGRGRNIVGRQAFTTTQFRRYKLELTQCEQRPMTVTDARDTPMLMAKSDESTKTKKMPNDSTISFWNQINAKSKSIKILSVFDNVMYL